MSNLISFYLSHDASVAVKFDSNKYRIYELERLTGIRYFKPDENLPALLLNLKQIIKKDLGNSYKFHKGIIVKSSPWGHIEEKEAIKSVFEINDIEEIGHHIAHAACAIHSHQYDKSLVLSYDGGGFDEDDAVRTFNIFLCDKQNNYYSRIFSKSIDLGNAYSCIAIPISEIKKGNYLSLAGKIMGLCAYGKVIIDWIPHVENFYRNFFFGEEKLVKDQLSCLGEKINLNLDDPNTLSGDNSYNLAATSQYVFEKLTFDILMPFVEHYKLPVGLTGGCALNVLFNEKLRRLINMPVFVPPNPNDCGLSIGGILAHQNPQSTVDFTYAGFDILDKEDLPIYVEKYSAKKITPKEIAKLVSEGKIIGIVKGLSECGPRALGNRSIICDPSFPDMKDKLNLKVKFREWFRPFAPMVRENEISKYFETEHTCEYMSFAPYVRNKWKSMLPSVTHHDGTSRAQTVSKNANPYIYEIMDEMENLGKIPILLNTSFNIKGKPILTTIKDAIEVLEETEIDHIIVENYIFSRAKND